MNKIVGEDQRKGNSPPQPIPMSMYIIMLHKASVVSPVSNNTHYAAVVSLGVWFCISENVKCRHLIDNLKMTLIVFVAHDLRGLDYH